MWKSLKVDEIEDYVTVGGGGEESAGNKANKSAIIFPALSMLDVSGNREAIHCCREFDISDVRIRTRVLLGRLNRV